MVHECMQVAFVNALRELNTSGKDVAPRGAATKEVLFYQATILNPDNRFITLPERGANPFAQIAETLWMLSGRNDLDWLELFIPQVKKFSDDGRTWRAGYGPRLRAWQQERFREYPGGGEVDRYEIDQIAKVMGKLRTDQDTRQAVITIWDPAEDWVEGSRDYPCLAGDTIVHSPEGNVPIKDVPVGYPVYTYNERTAKIELKRVRKSGKTGHKPIVEVHMDDGYVVRCTEDHPFMVRSGRGRSHTRKWVQAGALKKGMSLVPIHYRHNNNGYKAVIDDTTSTAYKHWNPVHRMYEQFVNGSLPEDWVVHHHNGVREDNRIANLQRMPKERHDHLESFNRIGEDNPAWKSGYQHEQRFQPQLTPEQMVAWGKRVVQRHGKMNWDIYYQEIMANDQLRHADIQHTFGSYGQFKSVVYNNHKVVKVVRTGVTEDVYDLEVDGNHNFFVGSGVLVHNCNNWLHFIIRDDKLHLNVGVRSNDLVFGFSHVDFFGWSVLLELMANWVGVGMGTINWNATSMHIYERHFGMMQQIVEETPHPYRTPAFYGVPSLPVFCPWDKFDRMLTHLTTWAKYWAVGCVYGSTTPPGHDLVEDLPWFNEAQKMLWLWAEFKHVQAGHAPVQIYNVLNNMVHSDMRVAALVYLSQRMDGFNWEAVDLSREEQNYLTLRRLL